MCVGGWGVGEGKTVCGTGRRACALVCMKCGVVLDEVCLSVSLFLFVCVPPSPCLVTVYTCVVTVYCNCKIYIYKGTVVGYSCLVTVTCCSCMCVCACVCVCVCYCL